jgi:glutaredoxin
VGLPVRVVLYTKPGCQLCQDMKSEISNAGCARLYHLEEIDIEDDADLFARYQYEIPILFINGVEAFRHRLRPDEFKAYVTGLRSSGSNDLPDSG